MPQSYFNNLYINTILTDFIALLYPEICIGCGTSLLLHDKMICFKCSLDLPYTHFEDMNENPVERLFWFKTKIEHASAGFFFSKKGKIQKMIHSFKYHGNSEAAIFMGEQLGALIKKSSRFKNIDLIIPVPLHPKKFKKRGFNQAERIAFGMSVILNIPVNTHALIRAEHNETQTKKALFNRWTNVESIFKIFDSSTVKGKHVLLVDDVITSGSTIEACANQILQIPNTKVSITTLAIAT